MYLRALCCLFAVRKRNRERWEMGDVYVLALALFVLDALRFRISSSGNFFFISHFNGTYSSGPPRNVFFLKEDIQNDLS